MIKHREMKKAREKQNTGGFPEPQFFFPPEPIQTQKYSHEPPTPTPPNDQSPRNGEETLPSELWFQIFGNLVSLKDLMHLELVWTSYFSCWTVSLTADPRLAGSFGILFLNSEVIFVFKLWERGKRGMQELLNLGESSTSMLVVMVCFPSCK